MILYKQIKPEVELEKHIKICNEISNFKQTMLENINHDYQFVNSKISTFIFAASILGLAITYI